MIINETIYRPVVTHDNYDEVDTAQADLHAAKQALVQETGFWICQKDHRTIKL